jgi:hypothetical protein
LATTQAIRARPRRSTFSNSQISPNFTKFGADIGRVTAASYAPHGPDSDPKEYLGTYHTQRRASQNNRRLREMAEYTIPQHGRGRTVVSVTQSMLGQKIYIIHISYTYNSAVT